MVKGKRATREGSFVAACENCGSPHLGSITIDGVPHMLCKRCGYVSGSARKVSLTEAKKIHYNRELSVHRAHARRKVKREQVLHRHADSFGLRMGFSVASGVFLLLGLLFLVSASWTTGALFLIVGAVGFVTARGL